MMRPISEDGFLVEYGDSTDTLRRSYNVPILLTLLENTLLLRPERAGISRDASPDPSARGSDGLVWKA